MFSSFTKICIICSSIHLSKQYTHTPFSKDEQCRLNNSQILLFSIPSIPIFISSGARITYYQLMYNKQFLKYERLKTEFQTIKNFCPEQYFAVNKCSGKCGKSHVDRCYYPCIHFYMGNCKYGFNCLFSHSIKRQVVKPEPAKEVCKKLYYENYCPLGNRCKFTHDLRGQPCVYNSLGKCKFSDGECRFSHEKKVDVSVPCFFNLMAGCKNQNCENRHTNENIIKYISYEGPI